MRARNIAIATLAVLALAACGGGGSSPSIPSAPTALQATPGDQQVTISWTNSTGATSYNLYWSITPGVTPATGTKVAGATNPYLHTSLANGTQYYYVATAANSAGESGASSQVTAIPATNPPPAAPTGVNATPGNQQVALAWTHVAGATSYNVYWSTTSGVTPATGTQIAGAANPYLHTARANGTPYYYVVTAVNANGESTPSSQVTATPSAVPFISMYVLSVAGGGVPPFGFLEQARVCTDATCNTPITDATVTVNGGAPLTYDSARRQYTGVQAIAAGAPVAIRVTAGGVNYDVSATQFASAPTLTAPSSGATWQGASSNTISWTGVTSPPSGASYVLGVMDGSGNFAFPVPTSSGGGPKEVTTGTTSDTVPAGTLPAGSFSVMLGIGTTGIAGGGTGGIAIPGTASGSGLWLGLMGPLVPITVQSASPPLMPTGVQATPGNQQVTVSWTNSTGATSYNLYWSTTSGVTPATGTKVTGAANPYLHTARANGTPYYYVVTAANGSGESAASVQVTATPLANPPPAAPTGVRATGGNQQVTLAWTNVTGATSYNAYWSTASGVTPANGTKITGAANPYVHTGRANATPYYYVVTALNGNGESTPSSQASATPSGAPYITVFVLTVQGGGVPPFGFLEQARVCTDATCNTPIATATVTVNGGAALAYDSGKGQYAGTQVIPAGASVAVQVTIGGVNYNVSTTQFASAPTITAPASGATWQGASSNAITWTGVASPPSGASYLLGVMDAAGNFAFPVSSSGRGGPKEVTTGTTSDNVPAGTLPAGSFEVMVGIGTTGIAGGSGGIAIPNTAGGSGLWVGLMAPLVPITVQSSSTPPSAPTGLLATPGDQQVTVTWNSVTGATSYDLYWSTTSGVTPTNGTRIAGATSPYLHTALANGIPYYYVATARNVNGESTPSSQVTATPTGAPFITAFVLSVAGGGASPFGFLQQARVCTDNMCGTPITNATVTVNGGAPLVYSSSNHQYTGTQAISPGTSVALQVTIGGVHYDASAVQFASAPIVTAPTAGATWQHASANAISWTGVVSPPSGASYVLGVLDGSGNFVYPVPSGMRGGPKEVSTGTTSDTVPASTLSAGSDNVMLGIGTAGISDQSSGGIAIPGTASGSGLWLGLIAPVVPVTVQ